MNDLIDVFINRFAWLLKSHGFDCDQFAKEINVSPSTVKKWRVGDQLPSAQHLVKISRRLDVSADYLLGLTDIPYLDVVSFGLPDTISERLRRMSADGLDITYEIIRYISAADRTKDLHDDHFLRDSFDSFHSHVTNKKGPASLNVSLSDLTHEQQTVIINTLKAFRDTNDVKVHDA